MLLIITSCYSKESLEKVGRYIYEHKMANGKVPVEAIKKAAAYLKMQQAK